MSQRLSQIWFECLKRRYTSAVACRRGRGPGCSRPGCDISPLWGGRHYTTIELPEITQDLRNRLLEGTNKNLCTPGPRKKEQWPHKRLTQTCLWVSRSLQWRCGMEEASFRVGGSECGSACTEPFEGVCDFHYLHHSLVSGQTTRREHSPAHQQKIGLKIYWAWPHPSEQDPVSPTVNLSHQEA